MTVPLTERDAIRVRGADAAAYLQGQISQDVESVAVGDTVWSLVLQPTGKVEVWFRLHRLEDGFLLDVDRGFGDALVSRLERFKLRTEVDFTPTDDRIPTPIAWPGLDDPDDEAARIRAGMPRMGAELTVDTIPGEAGRTLLDLSVSFTKGCYTGQELVARVDSRGGNVPRPIRLLEATEPIAVGDPITVDGAEVGIVTSAAGTVALAPVRRSVELGATVDVGTTTAVVSDPSGD